MAFKTGVVVSFVAAAAAAGWLLHGCGKPEAPAAPPSPPPAAPPAAAPAATPPSAAPLPGPAAAPPPAPAEATEPVPSAKETPAPSAPPSAATGPFDPATATATIRIRATVEGVVPAMRPIRMEADPQCHASHKETVYQQAIEAVDGKLANVIAWVSGGIEGRTFEPPATPVVLDQKGCTYVPHVFTVQTGQVVRVRNSDPTMHNVHCIPKVSGNPESNGSQPQGGDDLVLKFPKPEVAVRVKCDVHGWMEAWAGVIAHPFHGVTDSTGATEWKVPPGAYEVSAWQESSKLEKPAPVKVVVAAGESKEIAFVFKVK